MDTLDVSDAFVGIQLNLVAVALDANRPRFHQTFAAEELVLELVRWVLVYRHDDAVSCCLLASPLPHTALGAF